jgi:hypothetical protein
VEGTLRDARKILGASTRYTLAERPVDLKLIGV